LSGRVVERDDPIPRLEFEDTERRCRLKGRDLIRVGRRQKVGADDPTGFVLLELGCDRQRLPIVISEDIDCNRRALGSLNRVGDVVHSEDPTTVHRQDPIPRNEHGFRRRVGDYLSDLLHRKSEGPDDGERDQESACQVCEGAGETDHRSHVRRFAVEGRIGWDRRVRFLSVLACHADVTADREGAD